MFAPRDDLAFTPVISSGVTFGRAGLVRPVATPVVPSEPDWRTRTDPLARHWAGLCRWVEQACAARPLAVDLAEDIGSAHWLRGLATLVLLIAGACLLCPGFHDLPALSGAALDEAQQRELRALAIAPWRDGARQGRHYAPGAAIVRLDNVPERSEIRLAAMLGESDSVARMLQRAGLSAGDAGQVAGLLAQALPGRDGIAPGTRFDLTLGARSNPAEPRPLLGLTVRPRFDLALAIARGSGGGLALQRQPIAVDATPLRLRGVVGQSLYRAARAAGAPPETVQAFLQTIDSHLPFEAIAADDQFDLVVDYRRTADGQGAAGNLLYAGIVRQGRPLVQLLRWGDDGTYATLGDLRGDGQDAGGGALLSPVAGAVTSWFGMRRHPILGFVRLHAGIDYAAPWGAPVYAVASGAVSFAGWHGGHGNYIRLDHGGGIGTGYGHLSRLAVAPGMTVQRGQVIGYVGSTGLSTGAHLHYEAYRGGQPVDPQTLQALTPRRVVDPGQLEAFRTRLARMLALRPGFLPIR